MDASERNDCLNEGARCKLPALHADTVLWQIKTGLMSTLCYTWSQRDSLDRLNVWEKLRLSLLFPSQDQHPPLRSFPYATFVLLIFNSLRHLGPVFVFFPFSDHAGIASVKPKEVRSKVKEKQEETLSRVHFLCKLQTETHTIQIQILHTVYLSNQRPTYGWLDVNAFLPTVFSPFLVIKASRRKLFFCPCKRFRLIFNQWPKLQSSFLWNGNIHLSPF